MQKAMCAYREKFCCEFLHVIAAWRGNSFQAFCFTNRDEQILQYSLINSTTARRPTVYKHPLRQRYMKYAKIYACALG